MQYAVIKVGGKQYKVSVGDLITVDKLSVPDSEKSIVIDEVLMFVDEGKVSIGKPLLRNMKVLASIVEEKKGEKIRVIRFKAKSRYRKTIGFRALQTVLKIEKIETGKEETSKKTSEATKTVKKIEK